MARKDHSNWRDFDGIYRYLLVGILCLGLCVRLMGLSKEIWFDEYSSLSVIFQEDFLRALRSYDHPPLYFALLKLWSQMNTDEAFLRLPSVFFGIATVAIIMKWTQQYSNVASLLAGIYCATMPIMLRYSQEIRHYALLLFATALSFLFGSRLMARPEKPSGYAALAFSLTIAVATHIIGVMLIIGLWTNCR